MKNSKEITTIIHLELNEDEANWLKSLMQNPIWTNESDRDKDMRQKFWNNIDNSLQ